MVPSGLLTSAVVASAGVYGVSVSGSEEDWVDVGSGVGVSAVVKTVVWGSPVLLVVRDGDAADGVSGTGGALVEAGTIGGGMTGGAVGASGAVVPSVSLKAFVAISSGDGAEDGAAVGGALVTMIGGVVGGWGVGLVVWTAPEMEILQL